MSEKLALKSQSRRKETQRSSEFYILSKKSELINKVLLVNVERWKDYFKSTAAISAQS
jgi:hypothetical protein